MCVKTLKCFVNNNNQLAAHTYIHTVMHLSEACKRLLKNHSINLALVKKTSNPHILGSIWKYDYMEHGTEAG